VVNVSETVQPKIYTGMQVAVTMNAASDETITGTITRIAPTASAMTSLYEVEISIPSTVNVSVGMFADVVIETDQQSDTVVIPTEAILTDSTGSYVYITDGSTATRVDIETGLVGSGVTQITSGLSGGETLVTSGQSYLTDGSAVRVVGEAT
jgi:RND family efflux transporter MFP subunit